MPNALAGNPIGIVKVIFFLFFFLPASANAHNVDGNGQEGLAEAIHALQVAAGLTPDSSAPNGNAQPSQVFVGVTFSNENEIGLTGEYHGPFGCTGPGTWDFSTCHSDCLQEYGNGTIELVNCTYDYCEQLLMPHTNALSELKSQIINQCM